MALKLILQIFFILLVASQWTAFAFQPQNNENYVDNLVSHVRTGQGAPRTSGVVVPALAPARNKFTHLNKYLTIKKAHSNVATQSVSQRDPCSA